METIKTYLENMFMHLPKNREALQAKEELLNMMEDKYLELKNEGKTENEAVGIVISEFGNLNEVAEELGLSEIMKESAYRPEKKVLTIDVVKDFLENRVRAGQKVGIGVLLAIWSPMLLIFLSRYENQSFMGVYNGGLALGLIVLFTMAAAAVALFIMSGVEFGKYDLDKNEDFVLDYQADSFVKAEEDRNRMSNALRITIGVVLCIFSVIPVMILGVIDGPENLLILGVVLLLLVVGVAVFLFITAGTRLASIDILLKKGDYSEQARNRNRKSESIGGIYWPIVVIIYLAWSFISGRWDFTWIIWPLAGILFAAIVALAAFIDRKK